MSGFLSATVTNSSLGRPIAIKFGEAERRGVVRGLLRVRRLAGRLD
jgi:hypothetical protein